MNILSQISNAESRFKERDHERLTAIKHIKDSDNITLYNHPDQLKKWSERNQRKGLLQPELMERTIKKNDLFDINYLEKGIQKARTVCRIHIRNANNSVLGYGTGFLVSKNLVLTNNHVLPDAETARYSRAEFNYQYDLDGQLSPPSYFLIRPDLFFLTNSRLDYTLTAIEPVSASKVSCEIYGYNQIIEETGKIIIGSHVSIIQHPSGLPKQIAMRENQVVDLLPDFMHYQTDTSQGSSGSPVYNDDWELVALHHSGIPARDSEGNILLTNSLRWQSEADNDRIAWASNEGVRISSIVKSLRDSVNVSPSEKKQIQDMLKVGGNTSGLPPYASEMKNLWGNMIETEGRHLIIKIPLDVCKDQPLVKELFSPDMKRAEPGADVSIFRFEFAIDNAIRDHGSIINQITNKWDATPALIFNFKGGENLYEVKIKTTQNPWNIAREIEGIEGITEVCPDLESRGLKEDFTFGDPTGIGEKEIFGLGRKGSNKEDKEKQYPGLTPDWNHKKTFFAEAVGYSKSTGKFDENLKIRIAQIDTGYLNHPEIKSININDGFDFKDNDADATDRDLPVPDLGFVENQGHGTRTASIVIGCKTDIINDQNDGVFPLVDFVPFRVADSVVRLHSHGNITRAVQSAVEKGFPVITMSMGGYGVPSWRKLAKWTYDNGVIWVCAAGNQVRYFVVWPAFYPGVIAVAATDYQDVPWKETSRGKQVDISAPGHDIYVPCFDKDNKPFYNYGSGTSYATPHIAAAAALWLNHHRNEIASKYTIPWQKVEAFRYVMMSTARKPNGWDSSRYGAGIINALDLLKEPLPGPDLLKYAYSDTVMTREAYHESQPKPVNDLEREFREWNEL